MRNNQDCKSTVGLPSCYSGSKRAKKPTGKRRQDRHGKEKKRGERLNKEKKRFQPHFRKIRNAQFTGHPVYVFGEDGKDFLVLGITRSSETNGILNIPLTKNPEPKNEERAYLRPKIMRVSKGVENEVQKGWHFSNADKKIVLSITDSNKKRK